MYDDKLLRLKDVQELHHVGKSDEALKNFGFSSDDIDLIRWEPLLADDLQGRCLLAQIFLIEALEFGKLILDDHHDPIATRA